jgi:hypothetical protein
MNSYEKNQTPKYYFLAFIQLYASLLADKWVTKIFIKIVLQNLWLGVNLNYYFIKYYSPIFKDSIRNPNSISFMQASSPCYAHKVLFENIFYFGNLIYYWFRALLGIFEGPRILFELIWITFAKDLKQIWKQEKEKEK